MWCFVLGTAAWCNLNLVQLNDTLQANLSRRQLSFTSSPPSWSTQQTCVLAACPGKFVSWQVCAGEFCHCSSGKCCQVICRIRSNCCICHARCTKLVTGPVSNAFLSWTGETTSIVGAASCICEVKLRSRGCPAASADHLSFCRVCLDVQWSSKVCIQNQSWLSRTVNVR